MKIKHNLIANFLGQGWVALMGFIFVPFYIRYLGIESYGLIGILVTLQAWLTLLDVGMTPTLGREIAIYQAGGRSHESIKDLLRSIEIVAVLIALLIGIVICLAADWISIHWFKYEVLRRDDVLQALLALGILMAIRFIEGIYRSALIGLQRQVLFNLIICVAATLRGFGALCVLMWISPTIQAYFVWQILVSIFTLISLMACTYACLKHGVRPARFSLLELRNIWKFAGGMTTITLSALMLTQIDKVILSKNLTLSEFGYYSLATAVSSTLYFLLTPITQAFYPKYCELYSRGDNFELTKSFHMGAQLVTVIVGSFAIVLCFNSALFLGLWSHHSIPAHEISLLLSLLVIGNLLNGLLWIPFQMQLAHAWTSISLVGNFIGAIFYVPLIYVLIANYGAVGVAFAWVILNGAYVVIAAQFMFRRILLKDKWRWYLQDIFFPLSVSVFVVILMKRLWPWHHSDISEILYLSVALTSALLFSAISAYEIRRKLITYLKGNFEKK